MAPLAIYTLSSFSKVNKAFSVQHAVAAAIEQGVNMRTYTIQSNSATDAATNSCAIEEAVQSRTTTINETV